MKYFNSNKISKMKTIEITQLNTLIELLIDVQHKYISGNINKEKIFEIIKNTRFNDNEQNYFYNYYKYNKNYYQKSPLIFRGESNSDREIKSTIERKNDKFDEIIQNSIDNRNNISNKFKNLNLVS